MNPRLAGRLCNKEESAISDGRGQEPEATSKWAAKWEVHGFAEAALITSRRLLLPVLHLSDTSDHLSDTESPTSMAFPAAI